MILENTQLSGKPTPSPAPGLEARASECTSCQDPDCTLKACVHFGGSVVCLWIRVGGDTFTACGPILEPHWNRQDGHRCAEDFLVFDSLPAAEAEFLRRAELLRAGASQGQEVGA